MTFVGWVLLGAAVLVVAIVLPSLIRRQSVSVHTPLDERFAEDLRILQVEKAGRNVRWDGTGQRGTVFYRCPEVKMAEVRMPKDVRDLVRERAEIRARMARRSTMLQRGFFGACGLGVLSVLAWIVIAVTSVPLAVAGAITLLSASYVGYFAYAMHTVNAQDAEDRAKLEQIRSVLGPRQARGRRVAKDAINRAERQRIAEASREKVKAREEAAAAKKAEVAAKRAEAESREAAKAREEREARRRAARERAAARLRAKESAKESQGAGDAGRVSAARPASMPALPATVPAAAKTAGNAGAKTGSEMPSYTLKPKTIERRVVDPYEAPAAATAAVPYRPQEIGERYDEATGTVKAPGEKPQPVAREEESTDVLSGGSVLDALLERRRA